MERALELASACLETDRLTPFGAVVVLNDTIIGEGQSTVVRDADPTAHAEVNAIRDAARRLGTHDLSGATMFCSGAPCPFCLTALAWAHISTVHFASPLEDSTAVGFQDEEMFAELRHGRKRLLPEPVLLDEFRDRSVFILRSWAARQVPKASRLTL